MEPLHLSSAVSGGDSYYTTNSGGIRLSIRIAQIGHRYLSLESCDLLVPKRFEPTLNFRRLVVSGRLSTLRAN